MPDTNSTLVVTYLPRGERSKTKLLVDAFLAAAPKGSVEHLDLLKDSPGLWSEDTTIGYIMRNYMGEKPAPAQAAALAAADRMTAQLKRAQNVVLACPMWNFSVPAAVKAWFDNVGQKGETWDMDSKGGYGGLMTGRRAMILMAAGGQYESGPAAAWDHAMTLSKSMFQFMGYGDVRPVWLGGANGTDGKLDERVAAAKTKVLDTVRDWYGQ